MLTTIFWVVLAIAGLYMVYEGFTRKEVPFWRVLILILFALLGVITVDRR